MDHLPQVTNPYLAPVEIEYLDPADNGIPYYDNDATGSFGAYSDRMGWDKNLLLKGKLEGKDDRTVAALVQQWLFFGLLSAFRRHQLTTTEIIERFTRPSDSSGHRVVSTRNIERFLIEWQASLTEQDRTLDSAVEQHIDTILRTTQEHVMLYLCEDGQFSNNHPIRKHPTISFSIIALTVILIRAKFRVWPGGALLPSPIAGLIETRFRSAGWCPSDVTMLRRHMSSVGMYFVSLFAPRLERIDHIARGCDTNLCKAMNVDDDAKKVYRTIHASTCDGDCAEHRLDEEILIDAANHNCLVVVNFAETEEGEWELTPQLVKGDTPQPFVAISHVWAEGLGHISDNALPRCQLIRIQKLVNEISGANSLPFWIDTLSVAQDLPDNRRHLSDVRQKAIASMNKVYRNCSAVLVLDAEISSILSTASYQEQLVRFVCCSWIRRLWTLNEAVLGRRVYLQFKDRSVDLFDVIYARLLNFPGAGSLSETLVVELAAYIWRIQSLRRPMTSDEKIVELWNAAMFRSTSELHDEAICLSVFMDVPLDLSRSNTIEEKWLAFIDQQKTFPKDLMFTLGQRIDRDGYRWAPRSCIRRPASEMASLATGIGEATREGFRVRALGLAFYPPRQQLQWEPDFFWIKETDSQQWYQVRASSKYHDTSWENVVKLVMGEGRLAVVASKLLSVAESTTAVLVALEDDSVPGPRDWTRARFLATCNVKPEFPRWYSGIEKYHLEESQGQRLKRNYCTVIGQLFPEGTKWSVG